GIHAHNLLLPPSVWVERKIDDDPSGPLLSVIVAVYNVEKYLSPCLDSLVHQTLKDVEIIAVNDASTDHSLGLLREYQARYPQIRVLTCANHKGLASFRNIGLRAARGRYIAFLYGSAWSL